MKAILASCAMVLAPLLGLVLMPSQPIPGTILLGLGLLALAVLVGLIVDSPLALLLQLFPFLLAIGRADFILVWVSAFVLLFILVQAVSPLGRARQERGWVLTALISLAALACTRSIHAEPALVRLITTMAVPFLCFWLIERLPDSSKLAEQLPRMVYLSFALIGCLSLVYKLGHPGISRVAGYLPLSVTMVGYGAAAMVPLGFHYMSSRPNRMQEVLLLTLVVMAMLLTNTRMAMAMTVIGLLVNFHRLRHVLGLAIPVLLLVLLVGSSALFARFHEMERAGFDISSAARLLAWYEGAQMVVAHPLGGIGFDNFQEAFLASTPISLIRLVHSHNLALQLALDMGLIAMVLYCGLIAVVVFKGWSRRGPLARALGWSLLIYLMAGATDAIEYFPDWTILLWMLLGCLSRLTPAQEVPGRAASDDVAPLEAAAP